jgi:CubicO group peptidase (beta-lactamase class C family)
MRHWLRVSLALVLLLAGARAQTQLPQAAPGEVGLSKDRLDRIRVAMEKQIAENRLAGGIGLIARRGKIAYFETYGMADKESGRPMQKDAIFRIYSMTKAVTGVAVMMLYEDGRFSLSDPVSRYLPEFSTMKVAVERTDPITGKQVLSHTVAADRPITILDLLRHTSGLNYTGPHDEKGDLTYQKLGLNGADGGDSTLAEFTKRLASVPLVRQPGTVWDYSFSIDVLGRLVEVVSGQPLDQYFSEKIFKPLHMDDTGFYVPPQKLGRLVAIYDLNRDGTIRRGADAAQEFGRKKPTAFMGGGGLMSTATDYARFVQMLLNGGQLEGVRLLGPKTVELMRSDVLGDLPRANVALFGPTLPPPGYGFGLTFAVNLGPGKAGSIGSRGEYFWGGAAGTSFWIDPQEQLVGVLMIQTMLDLGKGDLFKRLTYQAIVDEAAPDGKLHP